MKTLAFAALIAALPLVAAQQPAVYSQSGVKATFYKVQPQQGEMLDMEDINRFTEQNPSAAGFNEEQARKMPALSYGGVRATYYRPVSKK
ncbi:hypothetical protein [Gallaecimonas sp. GXIMD4217]|uniref:hypothetical protein n=1 Tax=Gallaecimonas sp. GXIMD4217 TaxID=3131927 RepID=UPI00311B0574